jgi:hypothetical protein
VRIGMVRIFCAKLRTDLAALDRADGELVG